MVMINNLTRLLSHFAESGNIQKLDFSPLWETLKILVPAITVWLGVRATARKDQREFEIRQQESTNKSWSDITAQSREYIAGLQLELVEVRSRLKETEIHLKSAEQEVEKLRLECDGLRRELHELELEVRRKNPRANPKGLGAK